MATPTSIWPRSTVAGKVPLSSEIGIGGLAVNLADHALYSKDYTGAVVRIEGDGGNGTIASAATVDLGGIMAAFVDMSGTATIAAITLPEGRTRTVRATAAWTLTHGASLVLPGAANITAADGDYFTFRGYAGGVVRCIAHSSVSGGNPVVSNDTTTNAAMYPVFVAANSGAQAQKVSSSKLSFNPSTGVLAAAGNVTSDGQFRRTASASTAGYMLNQLDGSGNGNGVYWSGASSKLDLVVGAAVIAELASTGVAVTGTLSATGQISSTVATGTAPFSVSSTTVVGNLNVAQLLGKTWAAPAAIGNTTPASGAFTTVAGTGIVSTDSQFRRTAAASTAGYMLNQLDGSGNGNGVYWSGASATVDMVLAANIVGSWSTTGLIVTGSLKSSGAFGCNGATARTSAVSGGAVSTTAATNSAPYGYSTAAQADAIVARLNTMQAALIANGIMS